MEETTLVIEYEDAELEALIIKHNSNDKRYRKLKSNASFLRDLDKVMGLLRSAHNTSNSPSSKSCTTSSSNMNASAKAV